MNTKSVRIMALAASMAFAACGETTDLVLGELSEAEASDLAGAVVFATFQSTQAPPQQPVSANGPQAVPYTFSSSFESDVACPLGGMVAVSADFSAEGDTETGAGAVEYSMEQIHDACVVASEEGREFTLYGAPDMSLEFLVEHNAEGVVEWDGMVEGAIRWETDGRQNTCEVAIEFGGRAVAEQSVAGELVGTICGHSVQRAFSIG